MKKYYNVPATEVIAFVGESMIMAVSPGGGGQGGGGGQSGTDPVTNQHANPQGFPIEP